MLLAADPTRAHVDAHDESEHYHDGPVRAVEGRKPRVVATTSTFASLVREIAKDLVEVRYVSLPKFNTHYFQPKFSDVRNVRNADLFVQAGLDHELWTQAILEASGKPDLFLGASQNVAMAQGVRLLDVPESGLSRARGDVHIFGNPHIWMNPENARVMAGTLARKLGQLDPPHAEAYEANAADFITRLDKKIEEWKAKAAHVRGKEVVSYHKDIAYLADFLGLEAKRFYEPKPGIPPSPKELIDLEKYIRENGVKAIVQPVYYSREATDALAKRSGAKVHIICQNAGELPGTDDYISLFDYNIRTISEALK
jgi:zinc/manganese transport system substrate-binding protein